MVVKREFFVYEFAYFVYNLFCIWLYFCPWWKQHTLTRVFQTNCAQPDSKLSDNFAKIGTRVRCIFLNGKLPEADLLGVWWCTPPGTEQHPNWEHPSVILPTPLKNGAIINIFTIKGGVFKPFIFFNWNSFQNITNSVQ